MIRGTVTVPGDKSITHRALMLGAMGRGVSRLGAPLVSLDTRATASCLRALGVQVSPMRDGQAMAITGRGMRPFRRPARILDCRNSGTTARLLMGLLSAHRFSATLTGDASLRRRPMARVTGPLGDMGARLSSRDGRLPVTVRGGPLRPIAYESPVASAQVKTALLFAGLAGQVAVSVTEPVRSRDHTERLLRVLGAGGAVLGTTVSLDPVESLPALEGDVAGDFSSAAYWIALAVLAPKSELELHNVNVNPTRTGFLAALRRMGVRVDVADERESLGEPLATLLPATSYQRPAAVTVEPHDVPAMVDEIPLLACVASRAVGTSVFRGVGELRVKESDRLALVAQNLVAVGARAYTEGDTLWVEGNEAPPRGRVETAGDHRLAMSFAILGALPGAKVQLDDRDCVAVSYPGFFSTMKRIVRRA